MTTPLPTRETTGALPGGGHEVTSRIVPAMNVPLSVKPVPAILRVLPSLTDIAFLLPVFFLFVKLDGARKLLGDGDTGWHIRTGEWILANGKVPHTDLFSFTRPGAPWFAWEWLWDVIFAALHSRWGMGAVILASLLVICTTSAMLFRLIRRKCGNGFVAIAVTLLATGGCAIHWLARPHLFTLLFFVLTLHITERASEGRTRLLALLVPLTALWVNLHAGFFVLFLVLGSYIGTGLLQAAIEPDAGRRKQFLTGLYPWLLASAACFAATFANPYGWNLHKHVLQYLGDPYNLNYISEFQSMDFHSAVVVYFEPLMVGGILTSLWNFRRRRFQEVFLTIGWLQLALLAQRNIPLFALATAPIVAEAAVALLEAAASSSLAAWIRIVPSKVLSISRNLEQTDRIGRVYLAGVLPVAAIGVLLLLPKPVSAKFAVNYDPAAYPEKALAVLLSPQTHRIFAEDEWGDYLIYKLYPSRKVFVDGRSDFYGDEFCMKYQKLMTVSYDFQQVLDRYSIDTIVLSPRYALTTALKFSTDWKVVYDDHVAVIFRRSQSEPLSAVSSDGRNFRDRAITSVRNRDRAITTTRPKA